MRPPEDEVLLRDMLDHARKAVEATRRKKRADLDRDAVRAAALERFIEVIDEAASKVSEPTRNDLRLFPDTRSSGCGTAWSTVTPPSITTSSGLSSRPTFRS